MAFLSAVSTYVPDGFDADGRPRHLSKAPSESVHEMVESAARQLNPSVLADAADSTIS